MTLTTEQFESILAGACPEPDDLSAEDRARLAEARAVRGRLKQAFAGVTAGASLAERIGAAVRAETESTDVRSGERDEDGNPRGGVIRLVRWLAPLAVAAAVLVAAALLDFSGQPVEAGVVQLTQIHSDNLAARGGFQRLSDADEIARHLHAGVGFSPRVVTASDETSLVGCSVAEFGRGRAASYLLTVGAEKVSVIVTAERPDEMGLPCGCGCGVTDCACFHTGQCENSNIVSLRIGEHSYTAVGAASPEILKGVLDRLQV